MATVDLPQILPYQPRMSVARYHELTRAGAFTEHDCVELLDGVVSEKRSKNPAQRFTTRRCDLAFSKLVPPGCHVQNQEPVTLQNSEPEPDIAVVRGQLEDYFDRHPGADEVLLVIEVADTTLVTARFKAKLYAAAGILVYWIINLPERIIEMYWQPLTQVDPPRYDLRRTFSPGDEIPIVIRGADLAHICVGDLLP